MTTNLRINRFEQISSVPLGTEVALLYDAVAVDRISNLDKGILLNEKENIFTAIIIGRECSGRFDYMYGDSVLIGLHTKFKYVGWSLADEDREHGYVSTFNEKVKNYKEFGLAWMVKGVVLVGVVDDELEIITPNQKCVICNKPAPHVKPNIKDNFLCSSCKLLNEL